MSDNTQTRTAKRRTRDERAAELDTKIAYHEKHIAELKKKRAELLAPPAKKRLSFSEVMRLAKKSGITANEAAKKLGVKPEQTLHGA